MNGTDSTSSSGDEVVFYSTCSPDVQRFSPCISLREGRSFSVFADMRGNVDKGAVIPLWYIPILLLCLGISSSVAQPAVVTNYFPLEVGNSWTYYHLHERRSSFRTRRGEINRNRVQCPRPQGGSACHKSLQDG